MYDGTMDDGKMNDAIPSAAASTAAGELRLIRALEARPEPQIPADFAARVASRVPEAKPVPLPATHYGRNAMVISMIVLLAAILVFAPRTAGNSAVWLTVEWTLCAQLVAIAVWFGTRRGSLG